MNPVERAIEAVNGLGSLADSCGVRYQAVQRWRKSGRVPAERVLSVETASGVSRHELRPDLYPPEFESRKSLLMTRRKRA